MSLVDDFIDQELRGKPGIYPNFVQRFCTWLHNLNT